MTPPSWLEPLDASRSSNDIGFCATKTGSSPYPQDIQLSGSTQADDDDSETPPIEPIDRLLPNTTQITSDWGNGYCANVTVRNDQSSDVTDWRTQLQLGSDRITQNWNIRLNTNSGSITATPVDWARTISAGGSFQFGYCAAR